MNVKRIRNRMAWWAYAGVLFSASGASAVSGTWLGSVDDQWITGGNWSSGAYPNGPSDAATFDNAGNGRRTVKYNLSTTSWNVKNVLFKTAACGAYTIGESFATNYRLWLRDSGLIHIDEAVKSNQVIKSYVNFGTGSSGAVSYYFRNDSTAAKLTLEGGFRFYAPNTTSAKAVVIEGAGDILSARNFYTNGVSPCTVHLRGTGLFTSRGMCHINRLHMQDVALARYCIENGELFLNNGNTSYSLSTYCDGYIYGAGTNRFGTGTGENYARIYVFPGKTLTIDSRVTSIGGLDLYYGTGTLVINGINTIASNFVLSAAATLSVGKIGNRESTDSNVGCGQLIRFGGNGSRLAYTGTGETTDRLLEINNNARLDQSGTGDLVFLEDLIVGGTVKSLTLMGSVASAGEIAGVIGPGSDATSLAKEGTGLWRLTAANTYAGSTTVRDGTLVLCGGSGAATATSGVALDGGALCLSNTVSDNVSNRLNNAAGVTLNGGRLEAVHDGGAADFSETLGALTVLENASAVACSRAAEGQTATLTFASLARTGRGTVNFIGEGLGDEGNTRNSILFITSPALVNGFIGPWATVNGTALAMYDETRGVYAAPDSAYTNIAARGPDSVIPDNAALNVRITTEGNSGPVTLAGESGASVFTLTQLAGTPAVADMAGKTLFTYAVDIAEGGASLTLGANAGDGTLKRLSSEDGELILANHSTAGTLTVNAALAENTGATSLTKKGAGMVVLSNLVDVTGETLIQAGTLAVGNVPGQTHALGSLLTVTGGGETPTALTLGGAAEILNYGNFTNAYLPGDRCVVTIMNDFTVQGTSTANGRFIVGTGTNTAGAVIQKGGAVTASSGIGSTDYLGIGKAGGYGYYRMTGGTLTSGEIAVGGSGSGIDFNVGVFDLFDGAVTVDNAYLLLAWAKGVGVMNLFGGSYGGGATAGGQMQFVYTGSQGSSCMFNLLGPTARVFEGGVANQAAINMARGGTNALSAVNLNNGVLTLYRAYISASGTTTHFNFNGGTLKAAATYTQLMQGLSAAVVYPGGAKIDTDGFDVILNQPLLAPSGYGVTGVALTSGGAGYIGAPAVQIAGGSGEGATAIALVDLEEGSPLCGQITNILVTSAGFGYAASDVLTATLLRGGCLTPATLGAVTLGANASGSLTKLGAGTLTLGGACTYSGGTTVSGGTLKLGVADALLPGSAVTLDNGTLDLNGLTVTNTVLGTGPVVNGTLYAEYSPAGTNVVGSMTAADIETLTGVYRADVTAEGACDMLTFPGDADLSNVALEIVDLSRLNRQKRYSVATVGGTLSGLFGSTNIQDDRWHVYAEADGVVKLFFSDGLILQLR